MSTSLTYPPLVQVARQYLSSSSLPRAPSGIRRMLSNNIYLLALPAYDPFGKQTLEYDYQFAVYDSWNGWHGYALPSSDQAALTGQPYLSIARAAIGDRLWFMHWDKGGEMLSAVVLTDDGEAWLDTYDVHGLVLKAAFDRVCLFLDLRSSRIVAMSIEETPYVLFSIEPDCFVEHVYIIENGGGIVVATPNFTRIMRYDAYGRYLGNVDLPIQGGYLKQDGSLFYVVSPFKKTLFYTKDPWLGWEEIGLEKLKNPIHPLLSTLKIDIDWALYGHDGLFVGIQDYEDRRITRVFLAPPGEDFRQVGVWGGSVCTATYQGQCYVSDGKSCWVYDALLQQFESRAYDPPLNHPPYVVRPFVIPEAWQLRTEQ